MAPGFSPAWHVSMANRSLGVSTGPNVGNIGFFVPFQGFVLFLIDKARRVPCDHPDCLPNNTRNRVSQNEKWELLFLASFNDCFLFSFLPCSPGGDAGVTESGGGGGELLCMGTPFCVASEA